MRISGCLLLLLLLVPSARAEVKIIEMQHRAAVEIIDQVRELLDPSEKVQAAGTRLIIVADGDSLVAAEKLVTALDRMPNQLVVELKYDERRQQVGERANGPATRYLGTQKPGVVQSLRVQEGSSGRLEFGRDIPYTNEWSAFTGDIDGYAEKTAYLRLKTGFQIYPIQVIGNNVLTIIEPYVAEVSAQPEGKAPPVDFSSHHSRVYLPLDTWVPLATQLRQQDHLGRQIISWDSGRHRAERVHFIRISLAKGFSP